MPASANNPMYSVVVHTQSGYELNITKAVENLTWAEPKGQIAAKVTFSLANIQFEGKWLTGIVGIRDRVFVYTDTGDGLKEVFRGFIWDLKYTSSLTKIMNITAYDNLIYFKESEDCLFYASGMSTKGVAEKICEKWGVKLDYRYESITHDDLPLKSKLSDIFLSDLLEPVKKQTGKKYVMCSQKDKIVINHIGQNETVYEIKSKNNALSTTDSKTMSGMVTKIVIMGKENDDGSRPIEASLSKNTDKYGTLQKITTSNDSEKLSELKKEAEETLDEKAIPQRTISLPCADNPYLHKGDKVYIAAGNLVGYFIILGITHNCGDKTADVEVEKE